jgi:uncharacterized LabA/DUF88 family protein
MDRVIAYVDGFNLYFGLRASRYHRYYWLNLQRLAQNLLLPSQHLVNTKYFTARVPSPPDKQQRQSIYLEALGTLKDFSIHYGKYMLTDRTCRSCGYTDRIPSEKMTDVNIAVELLADAFSNRFDVALLISADSDLIAPVTKIRQLFPDKRVVVAFPPQRQSFDLSQTAHAYFQIGRSSIAKSLFPPTVTKSDGYILHCPRSWR